MTALIVACSLLFALPASAADAAWDLDSDFGAGTAVDVVVENDGVRLDTHPGGVVDPSMPWFDADWRHRYCLTVSHAGTAPLVDHPIPVTIDTAALIAGGLLQSNAAELRFVAADGATLLDHWLQGPIDSTSTVVWVKADLLPVGDSEICFYIDNPVAGDVSVGAGVLNWPNPPAVYIAVEGEHAGVDTAVVSYVDDNVVTDGITTLTLDAGETGLIDGTLHNGATRIWATGPVALRGSGDGLDTFAPLSWAGTAFALPSNRDDQVVSVYSPFGDVTFDVFVGGALTPVLDDQPLAAGAGIEIDITPDPGGADGAILQASGPVLVAHRADRAALRVDTFISYPATTDTLYGVRTRYLRATGIDDVTYAVGFSNGTSAAPSRTRGQIYSSFDNTAQGGAANAEGVAISGTTPIGVIQQADEDGRESTVFLPASEGNTTYFLPTDAEYVVAVCPTSTVISVDGATGIPCATNGAGPGKVDVRAPTSLTAGTRIDSDGAPFYLMYETDANDDETNVLGATQGTGSLEPAPTTTLGGLETIYLPMGSWTSDTIDAGGHPFFDQISWEADPLPAGSTLTFQIAAADTATGPFAFVGPDGTAATVFMVGTGEPVPAGLDGLPFFQVRAEFTRGTDPQLSPNLNSLQVSCQLGAIVDGTVFEDLAPFNGTFDPSDPTLEGAIVDLLDDSDNVVATVTAGTDGSYSFDPVPPGSYLVQVQDGSIPAALRPTDQPVTLVSGDVATVDVPARRQVLITATVFADDNGDDILSGGDEEGLTGVEVAALDGTGSVVATAITAVDGVAVFDLPADTYTLSINRATLPATIDAESATDLTVVADNDVSLPNAFPLDPLPVEEPPTDSAPPVEDPPVEDPPVDDPTDGGEALPDTGTETRLYLAAAAALLDLGLIALLLETWIRSRRVRTVTVRA